LPNPLVILSEAPEKTKTAKPIGAQSKDLCICLNPNHRKNRLFADADTFPANDAPSAVGATRS
jgi:hypothetical protein